MVERGRHGGHFGSPCSSRRALSESNVRWQVSLSRCFPGAYRNTSLDAHPMWNSTFVSILCKLSRANMLLQTPENYHRALIWSAVMTAFSHLDPDFESVFSIEAVNEPIMDATKTPGYGNCKPCIVLLYHSHSSSSDSPEKLCESCSRG